MVEKWLRALVGACDAYESDYAGAFPRLLLQSELLIYVLHQSIGHVRHYVSSVPCTDSTFLQSDHQDTSRNRLSSDKIHTVLLTPFPLRHVPSL